MDREVEGFHRTCEGHIDGGCRGPDVRQAGDELRVSAIVGPGLEHILLLDEVYTAFTPLLLRLGRDATGGATGWRLWESGGYLILGVDVVVGVRAANKWGGSGVGGDGNIDGEAMDRHLLDDEVGGLACGLGVGPGSLDQDVWQRWWLLQRFEDGDGLLV
jgi:hypothetical protein